MQAIYVDISMSLDGFIAGRHVTIDNPLGDGGDQLHEWMFRDKSPTESREFEIERFATTGALVMGRTMFDVGVGPWGDDPVFRASVFVVTHRARAPIVKRGGTTYSFVADGPDVALERARAAAGAGDICIAGGATVIRSYLSAQVIDELRLHIVPVLLGGGTSLFGPDERSCALVLICEAADDAGVVHVHYRTRPGAAWARDAKPVREE